MGENMVNSASSKDSGRKLFYGLFVFPLLIAVGMAVLLCTVVLLTRESETPESLITAIKAGSPSKRWQKAFELSNELNQGRGMIRQSGVMKEVIHILQDAAEYDAKTRSYMALALSKFSEPEVIPALVASLEKEEDTDVQLHLLWALGVKRAGEVYDQILPFLAKEQAELRKTAAYILGVLGDVRAVDPLTPLLEDPVRDVRWNAALALARLGNDAGYQVLLKMLDRNILVAYEGISNDAAEAIMMNAAKGVALLRKEESLAVLHQVAEHDPNLKVRQAAIEAIEYQKNS